MRAIRLHQFGPASNLRFEEVADPQPGPGQVRIAVAAAGVHLIDTSIRAGQQMGPLPLPSLPAIPGREVAGVVDQPGPDVADEWLGRRVVTHLGAASAGYAEMAVANIGRMYVLPANVTFEAAVAMIGTGRTALAILDIADLRSDDVVLVNAAAGGLGGLLVQAARNVGAGVVGLAGGAAKVERVRELGATAAVDYTRSDWMNEVRAALDGREISVVLDGVGGQSGRQAFELLGSGGRLVMFGWSSGEPTQLTTGDLLERGLTVSAGVGPRIMRRPESLPELERRALEATASGALKPLLTCFPLARAADAHAALESRATIGKTVLIVSGDQNQVLHHGA